jgi:glycine/D-amino acid oxidase-like deaminating enzyme
MPASMPPATTWSAGTSAATEAALGARRPGGAAQPLAGGQGRPGGEGGLRRDGEVRVAGDPADGRVLAARVDEARGRGYPVRMVDRDELGRLLPEARLGALAAASYAPGDGQVEPPLVLAACRAELERVGARLLLGRPARVRLENDGVQVEVGDERLRPRTTVLAAGAEAVQVAAAVGLDVPTVASPGRRRARALLAQAARFFPALAGVPVERWWLAWRAMPADRLPIVGPLPWLDSLYLAVTHSGVTLAPVLGRLVAREVADDTADGLLAPFRPGRFTERATRVMLEVESVFRDPTRQDRST